MADYDKQQLMMQLKALREEGETLTQSNPLSIEEDKIAANEWFQRLTDLIGELPEGGADELNALQKILDSKEGEPRYTGAILGSEANFMGGFVAERQAEAEIFVKKVSKILARIDALIARIG